jgi:hypothetical protein
MDKTNLQGVDGTGVLLAYGRRFKKWELFQVPILLGLPVVDFLVVAPQAVALPQFDEAEENILFLSELICDRARVC